MNRDIPENQQFSDEVKLSLTQGVGRMEEEHGFLKDELQDLYALAKHTIGEKTEKQVGLLQFMQEKVLAYLQTLDTHAAWEENVLFPVVAKYTGSEMGPVAVMEYEHEMAAMHIGKFLEAVEQAVCPLPAPAFREAASHLLQAYVVLSEHFYKEEKLIFPLARDVLADREQYRS